MTDALNIKRGDASTITFNLGVDLDAVYTGATVLLRHDRGFVLEKVGTITGQTVTADLTADDTATAGRFKVEVEMTPGPHTYPSDGYVSLRIVADLSPTT